MSADGGAARHGERRGAGVSCSGRHLAHRARESLPSGPLLDRLRARFASPGALPAGVLSGTSADGIDVAITRMRARAGDVEPPELLAFETLPFQDDVRARVRSVLDGAPCGLREAALLSRDLGRAFGNAARDLADRHGVEL